MHRSHSRSRSGLRMGALLAMLAVVTGIVAACSSDDPTATPVPATATPTTVPGVDAPTATPTDSGPSFPSAASEEQFGVFPEDGVPRYGGQFVLSGQVFQNLQMLDNVPSSHKDIGTQMHDNLFALDWKSGKYAYDGSIIPKLVDTWEVSSDGLVYTFHLRDGVTFHDGTTFGAEDVKASFDFLAAPGDLGPPGQSYVAPYVSSTIVIDPLTVSVNLPAPSPIFLNQIAVTWAPIWSASDFDKGIEWFANNNNGTGPFVFDKDSWQRDVSMTFVKNENYWEDGLPFLDSQLTISLEPAPALAAFETKRIDYLTTATPGQAQDIKDRYGDEITFVNKPGMGHSYILLNTRKPPFDDPRVRKAIYLWADRQDIINRALDGAGFLGDWINPLVHSGFGTSLEDLQKNNLAFSDRAAARVEAKRILADAGVDPTKIDITVLARYTSGDSLEANQVLTAQLRDLGFNATLDSRDRTVGVQMLRAGTEWEAAYYGGASPLMVPDGTLNRYVSPGGQRNYTGVVDPKYDAILEQINQTVDEARRAELFAEMDAYLQEGTYPMIPMVWSQERMLMWSWLKGKKQMSNIEDTEDHTWLTEDAPNR
jgi:peptide/nickel transport system substrate-binding protein